MERNNVECGEKTFPAKQKSHDIKAGEKIYTKYDCYLGTQAIVSFHYPWDVFAWNQNRLSLSVLCQSTHYIHLLIISKVKDIPMQ